MTDSRDTEQLTIGYGEDVEAVGSFEGFDGVPSSINVSINGQGELVGTGVTPQSASGAAELISSMVSGAGISGGSIEGGLAGKSKHIVKKASTYGNKLNNAMEKKLHAMHEYASDLDTLAKLAKDAAKDETEESDIVLVKIAQEMGDLSKQVRAIIEKEIKAPKQSVSEFMERNKRFVNAIQSLGANLNSTNVAGIASMTFHSVNEAKRLGDQVQKALKQVNLKKSEYIGKSLEAVDRELSKKMDQLTKKGDTKAMKEFLKAWSTLTKHHDHAKQLTIGGGALGRDLSERLAESRKELKSMVNSFVSSFAKDISGMVTGADLIAKHIGSDIPYGDDAVTFYENFERLDQYLNNNMNKIYQHLLELNIDAVDSKEIKSRFMSSLKVVRDAAESLGSKAKPFAEACSSALQTVDKYTDLVKNHRDETRKLGGSSESMNDLYTVITSSVDISGLLAPLEGLKTAIKKIDFFRKVATIRDNLSKTHKEVQEYGNADYEKSVGKAIGDAISKIQKESDAILAQVDDSKSGLGLEIDMFNESQPAGTQVSKEKLKQIFKWQRDARVGLYKTVEAIDLYLLHFTDAITKNPDAVTDLHKMLSATRIITRWYDEKSGDNLIRAFESFSTLTDDQIDSDDFFATRFDQPAYNLADLQQYISGDRAVKVYERCRRAVQGVVILKNIISYFISLGEDYNNFKSEKNIYMAPSNIYKNLVNYLWVSAIQMNTLGTEILDDNNKMKRMLTFEDTKIRMAQVSNLDPELLGINFSQYSINKLRLLKLHQELKHLISMFTNDAESVERMRRFVIAIFTRLNRTKLIKHMMKLGVYDFNVDGDIIREVLKYVCTILTTNSLNITVAGTRFTINVTSTSAQIDAVVTAIVAIQKPQRNDPTVISVVLAVSTPTQQFMSIDQFKSATQVQLATLVGLDRSSGASFVERFLSGLTGTNALGNLANAALRVEYVFKHIIVSMLDEFNTENTTNTFAIDDNYFILSIKAVVAKVLTVAGINSLSKNPASHRNVITQNPVRLILGGAEDTNVHTDAVPLYIRLPLLVEFYRMLFDDGNQQFKSQSVVNDLDKEQVSFVPEVGNIWSGLLIHIFDKSKHIASGIYSAENMKNIIGEINKIYKHYKGSVSDDKLMRHVVTELIAEVNRRFGVIKKNELMTYYRAINTTKQLNPAISEATYSSNDFDILNEELEFEGKSPSDEFVKIQSTLQDTSVSMDEKLRRLTDYKIVKDFRARITGLFGVVQNDLHQAGALNQPYLSLVERIRLLKKAVDNKSEEEKYDMISKCIEEAETMYQASDDVFVSFHELVLTPLTVLMSMTRILDKFLLHMGLAAYVGLSTAAPGSSIITLGATDCYDDQANIISTLGNALSNKINGRILDLKNMRTNELFINNSMTLTGATNNVVTQGRAVGRAGPYQNYILSILNTFCVSTGGLIKVNVSATSSRINVDLSEFQKTCEYLLANIKFMVDKFTGIVPSAVITAVTDRATPGTVYNLEDILMDKLFNKYQKNEKTRATLSLDNFYKTLPIISDALFGSQLNVESVITSVSSIRQGAATAAPGAGIDSQSCMNIVADSFREYNQAGRMYLSAPGRYTVHKVYFDPSKTVDLQTGMSAANGLVQKFNTLVGHYLNDLYDSQSRKIYPKLFETFAGNALVEAMNGNAFPDFAHGSTVGSFYNDVPLSHCILSGALVHTMKVMTTRVNPQTGIKIHEVAGLSDLSPYVMERYRAFIPFYIKAFTTLREQAMKYRKVLGKNDAAAVAFAYTRNTLPAAAAANVGQTRENDVDAHSQFISVSPSLTTAASPADAYDNLVGMTDDMISALGSIIADATNVQKELLESDDSVTMFFDIKKDFTKNYYKDIKDLPFAPLSVLTLLHNPTYQLAPYPSRNNADGNKYLYGSRNLMMNGYKLTMDSVPYMSKVINDFNGYAVKSNIIDNAKYSKVLENLSSCFGYTADMIHMTGKLFSQYEVYNPTPARGTVFFSTIKTFQATEPPARALTLSETTAPLDARKKVSEYVKTRTAPGLTAIAPAVLVPGAPIPLPRARAMMINIIDLNVVPINVHSLMRDVPLANIYNYAMTFDELVRDAFTNNLIGAAAQSLLIAPYSPVVGVLSRAGVISVDYNDNGAIVTTTVATDGRVAPNPNMVRFIDDILNDRTIQGNQLRATLAAGRPLSVVQGNGIMSRLNCKIHRNLTFATLCQFLIKTKVKRELEFINTKITSNTHTVENAITNLYNNQGTRNDENLFEF